MATYVVAMKGWPEYLILQMISNISGPWLHAAYGNYSVQLDQWEQAMCVMWPPSQTSSADASVVISWKNDETWKMAWNFQIHKVQN